MSISLATRGMIGGGGASDATPPVITVVSSPTLTSDPIVVSIYDDTGLAFYHVTCQDRSDGPRYTIWDPHDDAFLYPFDNNRSTKTGSGTSIDPYIFTIYRLGGWPTGLPLDIRARAVDTGGNEVEG